MRVTATNLMYLIFVYRGRLVNENRAMDGVYISGVFELRAGNRLAVALDGHSFQSACMVSDHREKSFFGAYRLKQMPLRK